MPIISSSDIVADDVSDLLAHIRESASCLSFHPRGTVRCRGLPLFRNQAARDLACLFDVDPDVGSWTCLPTILAYGTGMHVPDFAVERSTGTILVDAVPPDAKSSPPDWVSGVARDLGYRYEAYGACDLHGGFRLGNARDLLRYANYRISLGDRVRLLTLLDEQGPMPLSVCMQVIRDGRDPIGVIAAMALRRFVEMDLDDGRIGPETRVSRFHD
ncbi:hypothetical protein KHP60_09605 [Microvirga sp. 3-52]|uniref:hypothetical protein n=1 Tax=Microvirga sp. 3-52 TaxID=2792425 RepID=UPI001AC8C9D4|nr:hypothetical protein [Microvirga sp. 3-52]MBO1905320.1 hypothetical protein [Microvirga sp. 3-52]MBS7452591.1 hypothetical protein [Microvirga sp. 3-52]